MRSTQPSLFVSIDRKSAAIAVRSGAEHPTRRSVERALQAIGIQCIDMDVFDQIYDSIRSQDPQPREWLVPTRFRSVLVQQMVWHAEGKPSIIELRNPSRKTKKTK